jgi:general secretion pathway protein J
LNSVIGQWEQDLGSIQDSGVVPAFTCDGSTVGSPGAPKAACRWSRGRFAPTAPRQLVALGQPIVTTVGDLQDSWLRTQQFQGGEPGQLRTLEGTFGLAGFIHTAPRGPTANRPAM